MEKLQASRQKFFFSRKITLEEWNKSEFLRPSNIEIRANKIDLEKDFDKIMDDFFKDIDGDEISKS